MDSAKAISNLRATVSNAGDTARLNTPVTITLDEARAILGREAWLTDAVMVGAALWFEEITDDRERDYASECLSETAEDLKKANPRLNGGA
jgi:hypothetical protein